jgi:hypothetical protein
MRRRPYYSIRSGGRDNNEPGMDIGEITWAIISVYSQFDTQHYFQEGLGYGCVDEGHMGGRVGNDVNAYLLWKVGKADLWPPKAGVEYSESDLFDLVEFMFDCAGKPVKVRYHGYYNCGYHGDTFEKEVGQNEFREEINEVLRRYSTGFELSKDGEVLALAETGFEPLVEEDLPATNLEHVEDRVKAAIRKFRYRRSSIEDRREAVRGLIDVLEYLRPQIKQSFTSKDESDLFNIANNYDLRDHNPQQKSNYDPAIWLDWMFYFYLSTTRTVLRMIERGS